MKQKDVHSRHRVAFPTGRLLVILKPWITAAFLLAIFSFAVRFLIRYAIPYFRFEPAYFDQLGYWPRRGRLILHICGGMLALICGPFQFWTGLRGKALGLHRWTGRGYLLGVVAGSVGAFLMSIYSQPHTFGIALRVGAAAWIVATGISYAAILRGMVALHKEWMVRSYLVTFAFVTFRWLNETPIAASHWGMFSERSTNLVWVSWVVPLLVFEVFLQAKRIYYCQFFPRQ